MIAADHLFCSGRELKEAAIDISSDLQIEMIHVDLGCRNTFFASLLVLETFSRQSRSALVVIR